MSWPSGDIDLIKYVEEQQATALRTYEVNPDLLEEHVGQEDSFRVGGYGQRQVSELLQNAVDALTMSGGQGTVEFRIADGALYCANEGESFAREGLRAICYAFLSSKRGEDIIGRFGLGFKSVLGISDHPQIFSRSVSFEFNAPGAAELFAGIPSATGKLPLLRVPSVMDVATEVANDPNLAELMTWATTVVKLPLVRDGARIREELTAFKTQSLLFMKSVNELKISLQQKAGAAPVIQTHKREGNLAEGKVLLKSPDGAETTWLFAEREYEPSEKVLQTLTATTSRKKMTVSYAVPLGASTAALGQLWAWFPLQDQTTARGIFNAPWLVNDDRTTLIPTSSLNGEMLDVCAELFLDVVVRASTPEDPAAHLELFPARGREIRSAADRVLSHRIPELARRRPMIPDANGVLQGRGFFKGIPDLKPAPVPVDLMQAWQDVVGRETMPHSSCFSIARERYARLRGILRENDDDRSIYESSVVTWLQELAHMRTPQSVLTALKVYAALKDKGFGGITGSSIVPVAGGTWAAASAHESVLISRPGQPLPVGVAIVDDGFTAEPEIVTLLHSLQFRDVSIDQTSIAIAALASESWRGDEWTRLWNALRASSAAVAVESLTKIRTRGLDVMVQTRSGLWRAAATVIEDDSFADGLRDRHAEDLVHGSRTDLLRAAGCFSSPQPDFPQSKERIFLEYRNEADALLRKRIREAGHTHGAIGIPDFVGPGPLDLFLELADDPAARMEWTRRVLRTMPSKMTVVSVPLTSSRNNADVEIASPDWWAVLRHGLVQTSLGVRRTGEAVSSALRDFSLYLPVVDAEISMSLDPPRSLESMPEHLLRDFMGRDGYHVEDASKLTQLLVAASAHESLATTANIPAVLHGAVVIRPRTDVVVASTPEDIAVLEELGIAYLDGTVKNSARLIEKWGLRPGEEALSRTLEISEQGTEGPLTDRYPSLAGRLSVSIGRVRLRSSASILRRSSTSTGMFEERLMSAHVSDTIVVDDTLEDVEILGEVSKQLGLGLTRQDNYDILRDDETMRHNDLVQRSRVAGSDPERLLILAGVKVLQEALPKRLLDTIESKKGRQSELEVAQLYWQVRGLDSLWTIREELRAIGLVVPRDWAGSALAEAFVVGLGFATGYAGQKNVPRPSLLQVQGLVDLKPLHKFQEILAGRIRDMATAPTKGGQAQRGLLFLPTGAGKTRVTVEAIIRMLRDDELSGPILWIAQSEELCEQAVQAWAEVWRAIGDERVIDICRFWGGHELDESNEELQIVIATDAQLSTRIASPNARAYNWLSAASLVVIDEAHTAMSKTYTGILRWLGLTSARTDRPLLGLTATPYRGRNAENNRLFVDRFGGNKLEALDPDDPIGQLREEKVLSEVDHYVLDGMRVAAMGSDLATFDQMKEVTKSMLDRIGQDLDRMQTVVNDILEQDPSWPILVFAASVSSAHTIAALLRLEGKTAAAVDGTMRPQERRRIIDQFKSGEIRIIVNCDLLTQGFDAPKVRALYIARPTFSPNRYHQMIGRGLRGPKNGGTERCLIVNVADTFDEFGEELAFTEFDYLWAPEKVAS